MQNFISSVKTVIILYETIIALYRIIRTPNDYVSLQSDINAVSTCLASKYLNLNVTKCCCLLLSRKRTQSIPIPTLTLNGASLAQVSSYKYLGELITSNLMWSSHVIGGGTGGGGQGGQLPPPPTFRRVGALPPKIQA